MVWSRIEQDWKHFKESARKRWGRFSDVTLDGMLGRRAALASNVRLSYGVSPEEAERQVAEWQGRQVEPYPYPH